MRPCSPSQDALRRLQLMSRELYVKVPGVPVPQGSMSCINGVMFHSNKHLPIWRSKVQKALECEFVGGAFSGPIYAYLTFILPRPASVTRIKPCVKPDLDKLVRAVLDAVEAACAVHNDSQVCEMHAIKRYVRENEEPHLALWLKESN
jgi:crossover junction endodeoxyribonuclease RusA